jgi:uncharacterized protein (TIGR03083 family)
MDDTPTRPASILVAGLFSEVRTNLLELLEGLSPEDWHQPTAAPLWLVKDVALHLLGGDLGNLSRRRDGFRPPGKPVTGYAELVAFINNLNAEWVRAAHRLSTRLICDLLAFTGPQLAAYYASLDPFAMGEAVSWAGPNPAPVWLDVAREYTEQWHHQQQIRDATGRPALYSPRLFTPVLDTFMRGATHHYRKTEIPEGTVVVIEIEGGAGGRWFLQRGAENWELMIKTGQPPATHVSIPQDAAWRLFAKGMRPEQAKALASIRGDAALAEPFFQMVSVLA